MLSVVGIPGLRASRLIGRVLVKGVAEISTSRQPLSDGITLPASVVQDPLPSVERLSVWGEPLNKLRCTVRSLHWLLHWISYRTRNGSCPFNPRIKPSAVMCSSICFICRCSSPGPIQGVHIICRSIHIPSSILCPNCRLYHNTSPVEQ